MYIMISLFMTTNPAPISAATPATIVNIVHDITIV